MSETSQVYVWDLDGTIIDSLGILEGGLAEVLPAYDRELPSRDVLAANFHGSLEDSISNALGGVVGEELERIVHDFLIAQDTMYDVIEPHIFHDALELAGRVHAAGHMQIVVTNRAHEGRLRASPRSIVANSDLKDYIDQVVCGDDSEHRKPKPEVLGDLSTHLEGATVHVIGDQFVDAKFAERLGGFATLVCRDGIEPMHMERLGDDWHSFVTIVDSLDKVEV